MITLSQEEMRLMQQAEAARLAAIMELEHGSDEAALLWHLQTQAEALAQLVTQGMERRGLAHD